MDWLTQNWLLVVIGIGAAYYMFRGNLGGHGAGQGGLMGIGHGGHAGGGDGGHGDSPASALAANAPEVAVDAVSGEAVRTAQAVSSRYRDKIYHFASKENRDRFEAAPQDYAQKVAGHPVAAAAQQRPRRRGGCC